MSSGKGLIKGENPEISTFSFSNSISSSIKNLGSFVCTPFKFVVCRRIHFGQLKMGGVNPIPSNKFSDWSKKKTFADNTINVTQKQKFFLELVENIVGKGENAGYQHFLLFPQCFQKVSFSESLKVRTVWERVKP